MTVVVVVGASAETVDQLASYGVQTVLDLRTSELEPVRRWILTSGLGYRLVGADLAAVAPLLESSRTAVLCPDRSTAESCAGQLQGLGIGVSELGAEGLRPFQGPMPFAASQG